LRTARVWNTKASMSMPVPAITQATSAPYTPVSWPKRRGSENTPAPTIDPTTIPVIVRKVSFTEEVSEVVSVLAISFPLSSAARRARSARS
jgi:hypothetical protein